MTTRVCTKCGEEKDIEEFPLRNQFTQRRQSYCKDCRSIMSANWYENNKDYQKANAKKHMTEYRENAKEYVWNYLLTHPCVECGEPNPVVLEFHHISGIELATKKKSLHDSQRETRRVKALRQDYQMRFVESLDKLVKRLKFLDESGTHLGLTRLCARAAPGQRIVEATPGYSGPHYTLLGGHPGMERSHRPLDFGRRHGSHCV